MKTQFEGKTVFITGASFGIGKATAIAFAKQGAKVALIDWVEDAETKSALDRLGAESIFIKCDVSQGAYVKAAVEETVRTFGSLDFAFNNAGIEGITAITHECSEENWDRVTGVNLKGVWLCMKFELEQMLKQKKGAIVNNSSVAGLVGFQNIAAYTASKHGVIGLTKTAALEYARLGVRVNAVCPGVIKTPMVDRFTGKVKEVEKQFESMEPVGRMGDPEEVAQAVLWLCSDAASFVTGHALAVDGGWIAQ